MIQHTPVRPRRADGDVYGGEHFDGLGVFGGGVHRDPPGDTRAVIAEKTLHQLRHSRLTHLGEANVSAPLLMAISGHKGLAILQRYVKPGQAAVAALMASSDPDRRGR